MTATFLIKDLSTGQIVATVTLESSDGVFNPVDALREYERTAKPGTMPRRYGISF